ncbi:trimethylamine methyltransferase family protein [Chloroflexota bacterium]
MENIRLKLLTKEEVDNIYNKCIDFLVNTGVQVDHDQALKMLNKAGAQVDFSDNNVRFPKDIIKAALNTAPKTYTLAGQERSRDIKVPHPSGLFYTLINTGARNWLEPETNTYHELKLSNVAEWAQLAEALDEIDCCSILTATDMPTETCDIHALKTVLENTSKHIFLQQFSAESVPYLFELAFAVSGSADAFRERPLFTLFIGSQPPLLFNRLFMESFLQAARYGAPCLADPYISMGATTPITIAGTVLQQGIEILAMVTMGQIFTPGLPIQPRPLCCGFDWISGKSLHANIESVLACAASVQFCKEGFNLPTESYAFGVDSFTPDGQSAIEATLRGLSVCLAGADIVGAAGRINSNSASSPVQLMIDKSLVNILKRAVSGVKVDNDTLALQDIINTVPGVGHYMDRMHTVKHCREVLRTELFIDQSLDDWKAEGSKDLLTRALEEYREVKKKLQPLPLDEDVKKELTRIIKHADEHLIK